MTLRCPLYRSRWSPNPVERSILRSLGKSPRSRGRYPGFLTPCRELPKKPNYDFEKRKKEQDRKAKKDAKREERQERRRAQNETGIDPDLEGIEPGPQPVVDE